jgi:hypothetical protein
VKEKYMKNSTIRYELLFYGKFSEIASEQQKPVRRYIAVTLNRS